MRAALAILAVLCFWSGAAAADGLDDLKAGLELVQSGKYEQARKRLDAALESQWLSQQQRGLAHLLRGLSNMGLGDREGARVDLDRAVDLLDDDGTALDLRAGLAWEMGDKDRARQDLLRLAREYPGDLNDVDISLIWRVWRWLKAEEREGDAFAFFEAIVKAGYRPKNPGVRPDGLVQEYIGGLLGRGRAGEAMPLLQDMTSTRNLLEMRVNGRFKPLWASDEFMARTKPRRAAKRELAYWKTKSGEYPKNLSIMVRRLRLLRMLGDWDDAIEMGEETLENIDSYEEDQANRLWLMNELAYALQDAGRAGEADALLKPLLEWSVTERPHVVSQLINYGTILLSMGENERAIAAAAKARPRVSPFGRRWIDALTACANHRLDRAAEADAAMQRLRTEPEENYSALSYALLCRNRIDEAAQLALVRLRDPDHREAMLMNLQSYREREAASPIQRKMKDRWAELRRRPEIVAEARKHGRLMEIPLYPVYWGDV